MKKESFIDRNAKLIVILAVLCGSVSGSFGAMISAPSQVIGFWRLLFALPFFMVLVAVNRESRESLKEVKKKELLLCFLTGFFLFLHFYCWYSAVKLTNVAAAACLAAFHPLVVIFITVFIYRKRVPLKSIIAIIVALIGGAIIMSGDISVFRESGTTGNIFALMSGIAMGIYFAIGGKVRPKMNGSVYVLLVFTGCLVSFFLCNVITGTPLMGYPAKDYLYILCLALVCQIGGHAMWNLCMGKVSPLFISTWETTDPVFATLVALVMVGQIPTKYEIIGCIIVVAAILCYNRFEREE